MKDMDQNPSRRRAGLGLASGTLAWLLLSGCTSKLGGERDNSTTAANTTYLQVPTPVCTDTKLNKIRSTGQYRILPVLDGEFYDPTHVVAIINYPDLPPSGNTSSTADPYETIRAEVGTSYTFEARDIANRPASLVLIDFLDKPPNISESEPDQPAATCPPLNIREAIAKGLFVAVDE